MIMVAFRMCFDCRVCEYSKFRQLLRLFPLYSMQHAWMASFLYRNIGRNNRRLEQGSIEKYSIGFTCTHKRRPLLHTDVAINGTTLDATAKVEIGHFLVFGVRAPFRRSRAWSRPEAFRQG